jgi:glycosyltransferase involved in cell wall biosynthesis
MTGRPLWVHVFATFGAGGPQVRAVQLLRALGPAVSHCIVAMDGCTDAAAQLPDGLQVAFAPRPPRAGLCATVARQRQFLRAAAPQLVLTYNWGAIETAWAAVREGLPLVHHEDGFLPDEVQRRQLRRNWLRRLVLRRTPVVVPSRQLQGIATAEWRLRPERVHLLPNGVDLARFQPARVVPARPFTVGTVGGLRPEKDHATLLQAIAMLPAARLVVVGGGALATSLQAQAQALGIADRVEWRGPVADTAPCYQDFDAFVLSSRTEQLPLVLLEAMACALPVVATDVGDVRATLPPSAAEGVVPAGQPAALAQAIARLAGDPALRQRLGQDNRERAARSYAAGPCLARFLSVYQATANPRG